MSKHDWFHHFLEWFRPGIVTESYHVSNPTSLKIRDFLYLDTERVRSYLAQFDDGLELSRDVSQTRKRALTSGLSGELLGAKATGETLFENTMSSKLNYSLHDNMFDVFRSRLENSGRLTQIGHGTRWEAKKLSDGQFVSVRCVVKIIDVGLLRTQFEKVPRIQRLLHNHTMAGNKKSKQSQTKVVNSEIASVGSILEEVYRFLYGDQPVLIKLYPDAEHPSHSVTCQVNKQSFRDTPEALLRQYGHLFYAEWDCLILVNRKSTLETEKYLNKEVNTTDWMSIVESAGDVLHTQLQQLKIADEQVSGTLIAMYRNI